MEGGSPVGDALLTSIENIPLVQDNLTSVEKILIGVALPWVDNAPLVEGVQASCIALPWVDNTPLVEGIRASWEDMSLAEDTLSSVEKIVLKNEALDPSLSAILYLHSSLRCPGPGVLEQVPHSYGTLVEQTPAQPAIHSTKRAEETLAPAVSAARYSLLEGAPSSSPRGGSWAAAVHSLFAAASLAVAASWVAVAQTTAALGGDVAGGPNR